MHVRPVFGAHFCVHMPLYLNTSAARRRFKDLLGSANQLLVTILVGLSAVEQKRVSDTAPADLHAAWNPHDLIGTARRSRVLVLEMALARATDSLDAYISLLRRSPTLIQDELTKNRLDGAGRSVLKKFFAIRAAHDSLDPVLGALMEVMIAWRNKATHILADEEASYETWEILRKNESRIKSEFSGMEISRLEQGYGKNEAPTFKETASFIRATHETVRSIDEYFLTKIDSEMFLRDLIWSTISSNTDGNIDLSRKNKIQSVWGRDESEKNKRVIAFLKNAGLSLSKSGLSAEFSDTLIEMYARKSPKELFNQLSSQYID